ncbi:MAG: polyprenyl synthetase family protein [Pseudobdellovibrionaceae bacterium]
MHLEQVFLRKASLVDSSIERYFSRLEVHSHFGYKKLLESMKYSALGGGKRFRPLLSLLMAEAFEKPQDVVLPFACAVEMIHTYSLIHDDLPCMDNDDERRGKPTNHKVYGESTALLAGDGLLTEAFHLLVSNSKSTPAATLEVVRLLAENAGVLGMVGGQSIDLSAQAQQLTRDDFYLLHQMKTGALIQVSAEGAAVLCEASPERRALAREYGRLLGFAFQLKDDLHDHSEIHPELCSYTSVLGFKKTEDLLKDTTLQAIELAKKLGDKTGHLIQLAEFNLSRGQ